MVVDQPTLLKYVGRLGAELSSLFPQLLPRLADTYFVNTSATGFDTNSILHLGSSGPVEARRDLHCQFDAFSNKTLTVSAGESLSLSTPLSVEYNDAMFLGDVIGCNLENGSPYQIRIRVHQVVSGLQGLMNLRAQLLGEPVNELARAR